LLIVTLLIIICASLSITTTTSHANITSDTDAAALLGYYPAELGALCKTGELLGREDCEWSRSHLKAMGDMGASLLLDVFWNFRIHIFLLLQFFVQ
jgi:hypothetical protein